MLPTCSPPRFFSAPSTSSSSCVPSPPWRAARSRRRRDRTSPPRSPGPRACVPGHAVSVALPPFAGPLEKGGGYAGVSVLVGAALASRKRLGGIGRGYQVPAILQHTLEVNHVVDTLRQLKGEANHGDNLPKVAPRGASGGPLVVILIGHWIHAVGSLG